MFGIGFTELILIAIVLLVVIGPDKLPDIIKDISKLAGQIKKGTDEVKRSVRAEATDLKRWAEIEDTPVGERGKEGEELTDYTANSAGDRAPEPASDDDDVAPGDPDSDIADAAASWRPANTWLPAPDTEEEETPIKTARTVKPEKTEKSINKPKPKNQPKTTVKASAKKGRGVKASAKQEPAPNNSEGGGETPTGGALS